MDGHDKSAVSLSLSCTHTEVEHGRARRVQPFASRVASASARPTSPNDEHDEVGVQRDGAANADGVSP